MSDAGFFNINIYTILNFCEQTRFAQKVQGLAQQRAREMNSTSSRHVQPKNAATNVVQ